jgi:hypothetical protein
MSVLSVPRRSVLEMTDEWAAAVVYMCVVVVVWWCGGGVVVWWWWWWWWCCGGVGVVGVVVWGVVVGQLLFCVVLFPCLCLAQDEATA